MNRAVGVGLRMLGQCALPSMLAVNRQDYIIASWFCGPTCGPDQDAMWLPTGVLG